MSLIRIRPYSYVTVEDNNTNVQRLVVGPATFTKKAHETVVDGPLAMIVLPPASYCVVANPVERDDAGQPVIDEHGVYVCVWGDEEVRLAADFPDPFPLYPGEALVLGVTPLRVIEDGAALRVRAEREVKDEGGVTRAAGEQWLVKGPRTYLPSRVVTVLEEVHSVVVLETQALRLRATEDFTEPDGTARLAGSEWIVRQPGRYLCRVTEELVEVQELHVLTETTGLHLRATQAFTDVYGIERKVGDEWLVTLAEAPTHMLGVFEQLVTPVTAISLSNTDYCVIVDPVDASTGKNVLGTKTMVRGPKTFFLQPGERLLAGKQTAHLLSKQDALVLRCVEAYVDDEGVAREPGERWMVFGPRDYYPAPQCSVAAQRWLIPLDKNEGVYVRNMTTGKVRAEIGASYMLQADEELWEKELPADMEALINGETPFTDTPVELAAGSNVLFSSSASRTPGLQSTILNLASTGSRAAGLTGMQRREKWRVVTYRVPHNAAVQIFDYKTKDARVVFGPELVLLQPNEHLTVFSLSGGRPKQSNAIKSLLLYLGPDFMIDVIVVETSDHARLSLQLGYNWEFRVDRSTEDSTRKIFSVADFVGDACKALGSSIRGTVASIPFQEFHANSARIIRAAVFGLDDNGSVCDERVFPANGLVITNVDIQNVDPVDQRTRDSLQKSVSLAIEITTDALEARARNVAKREEQDALGELEQLRIRDSCLSEAAKIELLRLQAECESIKTTGKAKAEAKAQATTTVIECEASVEQAQLRADAADVEAAFELKRLQAHYAAELTHVAALNKLELDKKAQLTEIETGKFKAMIEAITPEVIKDIAKAGPEMQAKLLGSLGLSSVLLTDGNSPVNLFNTANGLVGSALAVSEQGQ
ncbi:major vault protein [Thecamonas trahens ATCC 50062]|uniref:Major vault protein n=1 Tax=Thecamonas trahens ATCC 50062 TaxID=461836 RepID=A0A0L0DJA7_THETB|nr:major vault protein [Thecamonas trahens ATCC 50062]KNC52392.1 major vault protein [Thecamonas trahens ATCC 50062]|eukprot:XP_013755436.1 major vault protein [Thecamonas trahens ATCC 50062]